MRDDTQPGELNINKFIDTRLPLWQVISAAGTFAVLIAGMYFQLNKLIEDVNEVKITIKSGNQAQATMQGELAILRFRVETLESDRRAGLAPAPTTSANSGYRNGVER